MSNNLFSIISRWTVCLCLLAQVAKADKLPNIIFVMTDDQGYGDVAAHGHPFLKTPNLDQLHAQSTRFTNYHVSASCAPTRAALMSGKNPFEVGVTHTVLARERMALGVTTVAEVLQKAGYSIGIFGKWHLGDEDAYQPGARGFDEVFIHGAGAIGQNFQGSLADVPKNSYFGPTIRHNGVFKKTDGFCTDVFFGQALGWIKENKKKPFFAYISLNAPHAPYRAPKKYTDMYLGKHVKNKHLAAFFGMITNIDDNMGLLMQKLDEWGLADETLLIFTTDNGSALGFKAYNAGMKGAKGSPHEGGVRVPLFLRLPGVTEGGREQDQLARHIDMFPTLADFAGADISDLGLEGRSLVPLLKDANAEWPDRELFFHIRRWPKPGAAGKFGKGDGNPDRWKNQGFAVRTNKWRLVGTNELYDIKSDPGETRNVYAKYPELVSELMKEYDKFWAQVRPLMVNEDASLDVPKPFKDSYLEQKADSGIPKWERPEL